ncbi:head-tail connector protein [Anoxybacillus sp. ST4]|uniref:head-tail connector protein n=1 Tax=Anoxybacillus sp. ST4 TaxID=2864181 RepID=UPI001C644213|nr:head-tail connector protein [Anoxybacillus sp. ST4]MBW7649791.1 head-tail connector protein [Anoxybacillus sp. ST4]
MASLENVKTLLGISDTSQDTLINLYLTRATSFVKNYCNIEEIPIELDEVIEDIAVYRYRMKGVENVKAESKGSLSETYRDSLPDDIIAQLNQYRKVKFV